jgi:3-polyprenyl-4-hydroxybenzoate decarboxylase
MSQLSLTKTLILVSEGVDVRNFHAVLREVRSHFDPHYDFLLIPRVPLDTLDFTSFTMNLGSRMVLDATRKTGRSPVGRAPEAPSEEQVAHLRSVHSSIRSLRLVEGSLLVVKVAAGGRAPLETLLAHPDVSDIPLVACVSEDVDIEDRENCIWGMFTRFDCARDVLFRDQRLIGVSPVYTGPLGIDATWKPGYPEPLRMTDDVRRRVEERWDRYWQ